MFGARFNHESRFFADGYELSGIESVNLSYSQTPSILKPLGTNKGLTAVSGPVNQTMSMSRVLTYQDPILNYTGNMPMSGSIFYDNRNYGFESGYLTDYSLNCAVGAVPRVSANFQIASQLKSGVDASLPLQSHPAIDIPTQGSISITSDNSTTNRVIGFDYGIKLNRKAYLSIGEKNIKKVELIDPIEYNATVQIDVDDAFMEDANNFFDNRENKNINLTVNGRSGTNIQTVTIPNASLVSENLAASANGSLKLTLNYIGHIGSNAASAIDSDLTYVFDSGNNVLKTQAGNIPNNWMKGSGDVYGLLIGDNVTNIGSYSFSGCKNLNTDFFLKSGVDQISAGAFCDCTGLRSNLLFEKSDDLKIKAVAFKSAGFVGDLILPNFISEIGISAFNDCKGFDGVLVLPTGLSVLYTNTFIDCDGLIGDINIPDSVAVINQGALARCSGFNGNLNLGTGLKSIEIYGFQDCNQLIGALNIPDNTEYLGTASFRRCSQLQEVNFGSGLQYVYGYAFDGCKSLSNTVSFKEGFTGGIGDYAFRGCENIKGLTFDSEYLSFIRRHSFEGCESLRGGLDLPMKRPPGDTNAATIWERAFRDLNQLDGELKLGEVEFIGYEAFYNCESLEGDLTIPSACTNVGERSFRNCGFNGNLYFEDYQTQTPDLTIKNNAFRDCKFKEGLFISGNERLDEIEFTAFYNCKFSNQLVFPKNIRKIGAYSFGYGDFTGKLVIPTGVEEIGTKAFIGCNTISGIYVDGPDSIIPRTSFSQFAGLGTAIGENYLYVTARYYNDWRNSDIYNAADGTVRNAKLRRGSEETRVYRTSDLGIQKSTEGTYDPFNFIYYIGSSFWKNVASPEVFIEIGENINTINQYAFENSNIVGDLHIPKNVEVIGNGAFRDGNYNGTLTFGDRI